MLVIDLFTLSMLISSGQQSSAASFAVWIVLGLMVGFIAGKIFHNRLLADSLLGIVGGAVGGFLSNLIGKFSGSSLDLYSELVAVFSAIVFIFVYHAVFRRRHFLNLKYLRR